MSNDNVKNGSTEKQQVVEYNLAPLTDKEFAELKQKFLSDFLDDDILHNVA